MTTGQVSVTAVDATQAAGSGAGQRMILMGYSSSAANSLQRYLNSSGLVAGIGNGLLTEVAAKVLGAKGDQLVYSLPATTAGTLDLKPGGPSTTTSGIFRSPRNPSAPMRPTPSRHPRRPHPRRRRSRPPRWHR